MILKLVNLLIQSTYHLILPSQLPHFLFQLINLHLFRPDITFKLHYFLVLLYCDSLNHFFLVLTEDIFDMCEVSLD
jgi:hypothetical protein